MEEKTIIIYSWSTLWSMKDKSGAPSFYRTVKLYIDKGWNVFLILVNRSPGLENLIPKENCFVLKEKKSDTWISAKLWTKVFLIYKILRYNFYATKVSKRILNTHKKNVVLYAYEIYGVSCAAKLAKKNNIPLVTRFQGTIATYFKMNWYTKIKQHVHLKALKTPADLVIMTDDGTKGLETLKRLGNPSKNIKFWKNGLDLFDSEYTHNFRCIKEELGISPDVKMLLTVSRLEGWKRVDRAISALKEIVEQNRKVKLVIVGDGSDRERLERIVEENSLSSFVYFAGAIAHEDVYNYMYSADVFLSLYDMSNVGNPLLEALTLGKCIVTLNVGDTNTVIRNNENGILLELSELNKLPEVILQLLENHGLKCRLEKNARNYAHKYFYSWDHRMNMEYSEVEKLVLE